MPPSFFPGENVVGLYKYATPGVIYLSTDIPDGLELSVLVHESVHWLQRANGMYAFSCRGAMLLELQAYAAQYRFEREELGLFRQPYIPDMECPK